MRQNVVQRCSCFTPISLTQSDLTRSGIPVEFRNADLSGYVPRNAAQQNACDVISRLSVYFQEENRFVTPAGAIIVGPAQAGKTHLAISLLKSHLRNGFTGMFVSYGRFVQQVRETLADESNRISDPFEVPLVQDALQSDLLLLDDVTVVQTPEYLSETVPLILRFRYNQMRSTIVTSRLPLEAPPGRESLTLELRYASVSRLCETSAILEL